MIMGYFVEKKAYSLKEWLGASLITAGIIIFNLSRMSASKGDEKGGDSVFGLALLAFSLFMDGLLSSCQGIMKENGKSGNNQQQYRCPSAMEMMLFTNLYAAIFIAPLSVYSGQFSNGIDIITKSTSNPTDNELSAIQLIALLNGSAAAGQVFVFLTIHHFSSLVCTTITTTRKFFTILLSVRNFGHVFSAVQWCSIFMVFGGLYFEIVSKNIGTSGDKKKMKKA
uniref:UDP-galactose transporter n=1 Tax=Helicotheca tamesis TaxID=374047 RepID=A0A7S2I893_9STRA|eukprot:CAMPEP_0185741566 /NCGR_PEP_ID=MMETSP1171-20130828/39026_1 /TAXON_ID=374046 /ORGANISM="Helicotheca tamensis, Strain CCMP826" /LENGTH=224 /DNA_ID=CAMNT_0028413545 /DNA_START=990 /DNA_END=1667 /DNA_ORIENTATION=-